MPKPRFHHPLITDKDTAPEIVRPSPLAIIIDRTPDSILSPNSGKHDRTKHPFRVVLRDTAAVAAGNALIGRTWAWSGPIVVRIEIFWERDAESGRYRNKMDWDNAISACKGAIDGVFSKLDANDRQVAGCYLDQYNDPDAAGYMIVLVEAIEQEGKVAA